MIPPSAMPRPGCRWLLRLVAGLGLLVPSCATWPLGARLDAGTSGLVGAWTAPPTPASPDTVIWRFRADGEYQVLKASSVGGGDASRLERLLRGRWAAYRDAGGGARPLVCFDVRGRRWPSCRYFRIDSVADPASPTHRRLLIWEGWVSERVRTTAVLTERAPDDRETP